MEAFCLIVRREGSFRPGDAFVLSTFSIDIKAMSLLNTGSLGNAVKLSA